MPIGDIEDRESSAMRSLERALHVLAVLEEKGWPMGVTELGRSCQLSKATVLRIVSVLEKYGFAEKRQGRYRLGAVVLPLAHAYVLGNELTRVTLPVLQELAQTSGETASLYVRLRFKRILVQRVEGPHPLRFVLPIGQRLPLHVGAGKVLAAAMSPEELKRMLDELGEMHLSNGKRLTRKSLLSELNRVRRQGYSISHGEQMVGTVVVAAPIIDADGMTIAAVSVVGAADRLTPKKIEWLTMEVRGAAKAIAERYDAGLRGK